MLKKAVAPQVSPYHDYILLVAVLVAFVAAKSLLTSARFAPNLLCKAAVCWQQMRRVAASLDVASEWERLSLLLGST